MLNMLSRIVNLFYAWHACKKSLLKNNKSALIYQRNTGLSLLYCLLHLHIPQSW